MLPVWYITDPTLPSYRLELQAPPIDKPQQFGFIYLFIYLLLYSTSAEGL